MNDRLLTISWPLSKSGEALEALAKRSGLSPRLEDVPHLPISLQHDDEEELARFMDSCAQRMNLEAKPIACSYHELKQMLRTIGPALLRLPTEEGFRILLVLRRRRGAVHLLDSQLSEHRVSVSVIAEALGASFERPLADQLDDLVNRIGGPKRKRAVARQAVLNERLGGVSISCGWILELSPGASFTSQLRRAHVLRHGVALAGAHAFQYALWLMAWWVVGRGTLEGRVDYGWLIAWIMLLITLIPLRLFITWIQGSLAITVGGLLKQRLLLGALRLDPRQTRQEGTGQFLGRIIETDALESLALNGGFAGLLAIIELCFAFFVLSQGRANWVHLLLLGAWLVLSASLFTVYFRQRRCWMKNRLGITHELVERMIGHRTRLAQEPREHWHQGEDQALELYYLASEKMDRTSVLLASLVARGWLLIGVSALSYSFVHSNPSTSSLAIALGGVLIAYSALRRLAASGTQLTDAVIAWKQVAPVFRAAAKRSSIAASLSGNRDNRSQDKKVSEVIVDGRNLVFNYHSHGEPLIKGINLRISRGDRILLEGPSGGGKSTLVSLLAGLRSPDSGLLLLHGFDQQTLGDENWRRRVVAAPQFHENYVLAETFAFNLLMGRWPPQPGEMEEAENICRNLGLGELIDRMPAGMMQMVGENGWQLSHGERSRLYIARAILQHPDLMVLDESFAALDPENLRLSLNCVLSRANTVVVIAHP